MANYSGVAFSLLFSIQLELCGVTQITNGIIPFPNNNGSVFFFFLYFCLDIWRKIPQHASRMRLSVTHTNYQETTLPIICQGNRLLLMANSTRRLGRKCPGQKCLWTCAVSCILNHTWTQKLKYGKYYLMNIDTHRKTYQGNIGNMCVIFTFSKQSFN